MNAVTEKEISKIIKKHSGFALFLALVPIVFLLVVGLFEKQAYDIAPFVLPVSTIGVVVYFIKQVLTELYAN